MSPTARSTTRKAHARKALAATLTTAKAIVRVSIPTGGLVCIWIGAREVYPPAAPLAVGMLLWLDSTLTSLRRRPG